MPLGKHGLEHAAIDERIEEGGVRLQFDMLNRRHGLFQLASPSAIQQDLAGTLKGGIADLGDAVFRHWRDEADVHGIADVDIVRESARKKQPIDGARVDAKLAHE